MPKQNKPKAIRVAVKVGAPRQDPPNYRESLLKAQAALSRDISEEFDRLLAKKIK